MGVAVQCTRESIIIGVTASTIASDLSFAHWFTASAITSKQPVHTCAGEAATTPRPGRREVSWTVAIGDGDAFAADGRDEREGEEGYERTCGPGEAVERGRGRAARVVAAATAKKGILSTRRSLVRLGRIFFPCTFSARYFFPCVHAYWTTALLFTRYPSFDMYCTTYSAPPHLFLPSVRASLCSSRTLLCSQPSRKSSP